MLTTEVTTRTLGATAVVHESLTRPALAIAPDQMEELRATAGVLASTDPAFSAALVRDPRQTIAALIELNTGGAYELQSGLNIVALQQPENASFVVIPSPDKAATSNTELAKLSLEVASNPRLREALLSSPAEILESFLRGDGASNGTLTTDKNIKVFLEDAGEVLIVIPQASAASSASVASEELFTRADLEAHMSCHTCDCHTAKSCHTGTCHTAAGCHTWSSSCR